MRVGLRVEVPCDTLEHFAVDGADRHKVVRGPHKVVQPDERLDVDVDVDAAVREQHERAP